MQHTFALANGAENVNNSNSMEFYTPYGLTINSIAISALSTLTDEEIGQGLVTTVAVTITNNTTGESVTTDPVAVTTTRSYKTVNPQFVIPAESQVSITMVEVNAQTFINDDTVFFAGSWTGTSITNISNSYIFDMNLTYTIENTVDSVWWQHSSYYNGYVRAYSYGTPAYSGLGNYNSKWRLSNSYYNGYSRSITSAITAYGGPLTPFFVIDSTFMTYPHTTGVNVIALTWNENNIIWGISTAYYNGYPRFVESETVTYDGYQLRLNGTPKNCGVWRISTAIYNGYPRITSILYPKKIIRIDTAKKLVALFNGEYGWGSDSEYLYIELMNDIDMEDMGPLYNYWNNSAFVNTVRWYFDGKNHSINNFYYCRLDREFRLFQTSRTNSRIQNVTFNDLYIRAYRITIVGNDTNYSYADNVHINGVVYATGYIYLYDVYSATRCSFNGSLFHLTNGDCYVFYCKFITDCSANVESTSKHNFTIFRSDLNMRCWARLRNALNCTMAYGTTAFSIFIPEHAAGTVTIPGGTSVIYDEDKVEAGNVTLASTTALALSTAEIQNAELMAKKYGFPYYLAQLPGGE